MVNFFKKQMFGSSSEKTPKEELSNQLSIFNEAEVYEDPNYEDLSFTTPKKHASIKKKFRKEQFTKDLPVEEITYAINDEDQYCPKCNTQLKVILQFDRSK